jgi:hypothetical protein
MDGQTVTSIAHLTQGVVMRLGKLLARGYAEENETSVLEEAPAAPVTQPRPAEAAAEETPAAPHPVAVTTEG